MLRQIMSSRRHAASLVAVLLLSNVSVRADDEKPCVVFSGNSTEERAIPLESFRRIYFGENSMRVIPIRDGYTEEELLYSLFHHLEFRDAVVTGIGQNEGLEVKAARIVYSPDDKSLCIKTSSNRLFTLGLFALDGQKILTGKLQSGENLALSALPGGVYIAVAVCGDTKLNLKFIIK